MKRSGKGAKFMEPRDVKEVEQILDLKTRKENQEKRRHRNYIFSEVLKCIFLLIVAMISAAIIVLLSEAAP